MVTSQSWGGLLLLFWIIMLMFYEGVHEMGHPLPLFFLSPKLKDKADRMQTKERGQSSV